MGARRALLLFRLCFYPLAALLLVWLLFWRGGDEPEAARSTTHLAGTTSRALPVRLVLDGERPTYFATRLDLECWKAPPFKVWWRVAGDDLIRDRDHLVVHSNGTMYSDRREVGLGVLRAEGRIDARQYRGEMRYDLVTDGRSRCHSGDVTFTAQR